MVDPVFAAPSGYATGVRWTSLFGYAAQLFSDFAGYSLMALGTGKLFGLTLPDNFHHPFLSKSLAELWRRWHISLNTWLFDYLFVPLTTGRSWFRGRTGAGFLVVFLVSGLWHGATWTFVLWGLAHGVALAGHHAYDQWYKGRCRKDRRWVTARKSRPYALASWFVTQLFFVGYHLLEVGPGPVWKARFLALPAPLRGVAYGLALAFLFIYVPLGASTFIYAQF